MCSIFLDQQFLPMLQVKPQCYPTCRSDGQVSQFPDTRGFWTGASACVLLSWSRYFECMQVYALPMDHREATESKGTMEIVSGLAQSHKVEV